MTKIGRKTACLVTLVFIAGALPAASVVAADRSPDPDGRESVGYFSGQATDSDGKPLGGVRVFLVPQKDAHSLASMWTAPGALEVRAETGADGRFEIDAEDATDIGLDGVRSRRDCVLIATVDGYGTEWISIPGRAQAAGLTKMGRNVVKPTDLELQFAADDVPIQGQFLDPDGRPLEGARVQLFQLYVPLQQDLDAYLDREATTSPFASFGGFERWLSQPQPLPGLIAEARTDADGRFTLSGFGRDRLAELRVTAPSVIDTHLMTMTRDAPDIGIRPLNGVATRVIHGAGFTLQLKPGATVRGRVIDRESRKPIEGMWVGTRMDSPLAGLTTGEYHRTTDAEGRFTITGIKPQLLKPNAKVQFRTVTAVSPPGLTYQTAQAVFEGDAELLIECPRGIPFRLKLLDEQGRPVEADVTYVAVVAARPGPRLARMLVDTRRPIGRAAQTADGAYQGFVQPGPGAVRAKVRGRLYRPAYVDPNAFVAARPADLTKSDSADDSGQHATLATVDQHDYAAIVLVNPAPESAPLELSATVVRDRPRAVVLIDPEGQPVEGVQTDGMTFTRHDAEPPLRGALFSLRGLHPHSVRRITFTQNDRKLIGFLLARGDGAAPYTVRMQPWAAVRGRIVDEEGKPTRATLTTDTSHHEINLDATVGEDVIAKTNPAGQFRIDKLVPGQRYTVRVYRGNKQMAGTALENLALRPGEVRQLGDIPTSVTVDSKYLRPTEEQQQATAKIPLEAWGEPVAGLRVAIVPRSPPVDANDCLRYDIVAENVGRGDIRFAAAIHEEYGFCKIGLVDDNGNQLPRQPGVVIRFADPPRLVRYWLKPKQRTVISSCITQLVRLDPSGRAIASPRRNLARHSFSVQPGRYTISAVVELGPTIEGVDPATGTPKLLSPEKGEWTGRLQTGAAIVSLFDAAAK